MRRVSRPSSSRCSRRWTCCCPRTLSGAEPFEFALETLEEAWGDQQQRDRRHARAGRARPVEGRAAQPAGREDRQRDARAPGRVGCAARGRRFIPGPWSQVMAQARLADETGAADPGGFAGVVATCAGARSRAWPPATRRGWPGWCRRWWRRCGTGWRRSTIPRRRRSASWTTWQRRIEQALKSREQPGRPVPLSTSMTREQLEAMFGDEDERARPVARRRRKPSIRASCRPTSP